MSQLKTMVVAEKNRLHAVTSSEEHADPDTLESIENHLGYLEQEIARLEAHGQSIINEHPDLKKKQKRMQTIPGIAQLSSMVILSELTVLSKNMTIAVQQRICYCKLFIQKERTHTENKTK